MMPMNRTIIFVCLHKENLPFIRTTVFNPIYVGNKYNDMQGFIIDNTGEHIHEKNGRYGELTALYWIWKNYPIQDFVGLCHYRRYFWVKQFSVFYPTSMSALKFEKMKQEFAFSGERDLGNADIILPRSVTLKITVQEQFLKYHHFEDLKRMRQVMEEIHPEYLGAWDKVMLGNKLNLIIMFLTKKEIFDQYCCWLFPLMFRFDELDNQQIRIGYQQRVNAFMAERMMNIFVLHNKLRVKELPYVMVGNKTRYGLNIWFKFVNKLNDWIFRGSKILKGYDI